MTFPDGYDASDFDCSDDFVDEIGEELAEINHSFIVEMMECDHLQDRLLCGERFIRGESVDPDDLPF